MLKEVILPIATLVLGWGLGLFTEPIRSWIMGPRVKIEFLNEGEFMPRTPTTANREAYYIRVRVTNTGRALARAARAYLVKIERWALDQYQSTGFIDPVQLAWATRPQGEQFDGWDLPREMPVFADVIMTVEGSSRWTPQIQIRFEGLQEESGNFRLHVVVAGDGFRPATCCIEFRWSGDWSGFGVNSIQARPTVAFPSVRPGLFWFSPGQLTLREKIKLPMEEK